MVQRQDGVGESPLGGHAEVGTLALKTPCQGASGRWHHLGHPLLALRGEAGGDESRAGPASIGQVPEDVAFQTHSQQPGTETARFQPSGAGVAPAELVELPEWLLGPWDCLAGRP